MSDAELVRPIRDVRRLIVAAHLWSGTPWAPNSAAPGPRGGVACHLLPRAIYVDAGWLPIDFPAPSGSPGDGRHGGPGIIEPWMQQCGVFDRVPAWPRTLDRMTVIGDLLGFSLGPRGVVGHLGVMLCGRFIHVLQHKGTTVDQIEDPTWRRRLLRVWRLQL